jgi:hypothetical protein
MATPVRIRWNKEAQPHRDQHGRTDGDRLVIGHIDAQYLELGRLAEERDVVANDGRVPDPLGQGDEGQRDADRDHDFGDLGRVAQPRMMPTCSPAPNSGANTKRTRIKASGAGQFHP